jgi:putative DNA primase/helicase
MTLDELATRFRGPVKRDPRGLTVFCPVHPDGTKRNRPSLRLSENPRTGQLYVKCWATCPTNTVLGCVGLTREDLRPARGPTSPRVVEEYPYHDEAGELRKVVERLEPKAFRQRRPDGRGGWIWNLHGVRPVLYRLPELRGAARVLVPEGERCVDILRGLGLAATCNPGGAGQWRDDYTRQLVAAGVREVLVLPDNDAAGAAHAREIERSCCAANLHVGVLPLTDLPPKGDIKDWLAAGHTGEELVALVADVLTPARGDEAPSWEPPLSLDTLRVPPFPAAVLPVWLLQFVSGVAEALQVPVDLPALLTLAALSAAIARNVEVEVWEGWVEPVNLFVVVALPPGEGKSPVFGVVIRPFESWERERAEQMRPLIAEKRAEHEVLRKRLDLAQDCAAKHPTAENEQAARHAARALAEHEVPVLPRLIVDDATPERVAPMLAEQGGRLAVMSAEGGVFELMAGRYSKTGAPNFDVFLKGHAGDAVRVDRSTRPPVHVERPALTLALTVQPQVLARLRDTPEFRGRGLLARVLYSLPTSRVGTRAARPPSLPPAVVSGYDAHVRGLLDDQPREPRRLRLSGGAVERLVSVRQELEAQLKPNAPLAPLADWANKLSGHVVRLAGVLHVADRVDDFDRAAESSEIPETTMARAIRLGEYFVAHARMAFRAMELDPVFVRAKRVHDYLRGHPEKYKGPAAHVNRRDLHRSLQGTFPRVADLERVLALLVEYGYLRRDDPPVGPQGGRASPSYLLNPLTYAPEPGLCGDDAVTFSENLDTTDRTDPATASHGGCVSSVKVPVESGGQDEPPAEPAEEPSALREVDPWRGS